jgi:hypothetical protein
MRAASYVIDNKTYGPAERDQLLLCLPVVRSWLARLTHAIRL